MKTKIIILIAILSVVIYAFKPRPIPTGRFCGSYTHILTATTYNRIHDTTITGIWFSSTTNAPCVSLNNSYNVKFINCVFGQVSILGEQNEGLLIYQGVNIITKNCYFENVSTGVYVLGSKSIKVDTCQFKNVQGPFPRGNAVQFNNVSGIGCSISYNRIQNFDGHSNPTDNINLYQSNGTATSPIQINFNYIKCHVPTSLSGGGILLGDNGGSYQVAKYNNILSPGNYGIAIAGGFHMTLSNNRVYSPKHIGAGTSNVGINFNNYTPTVVTPYFGRGCGLNVIQNNQISWYSDRFGIVNNVYNPGTCSTLFSNTLNAVLDSTIVPTPLLTTCTPVH